MHARFDPLLDNDYVGLLPVCGIKFQCDCWINFRCKSTLEAAAAGFRRATEYYDHLNYDEPEPLPFSPRHWLHRTKH